MSGTRHHFIPRFLLRGFTSQFVGDEQFVWVVRRDRSPFNTNIRNIAVEGHFYTIDGSAIVDDLITDVEPDLAKFVSELCASPDLPIDPNRAAHLLAHLEVRTRHLRQNFEVIGNVIAKQMVAFVRDYDAFKKFVIDTVERDPESLVGPLRKVILRRGMTPASTEILLSLIRPVLPELVDEILPSLASELIAVIERLSIEQPNALRKVVKRGQLRGLERSLAPISKVAKYERLSYSVRRAPRELVLGDSAVLFEVLGDRRFTTFISQSDVLLAAYLPLTPRAVLVGCTSEHHPSLEQLPEAIAQCALDYFVAASNSEHVNALQPLLGSLAMIFEAGTIEQLLSEALRSSV